jgi:hypothetical protein
LCGARFLFRFNSSTPAARHLLEHHRAAADGRSSLDTFITPRWTVPSFAEGLYLKVGDVKGSVAYLGLSTDYMLTRHFGLGLGISSAKVGVDATKNDFNGSAEWRTTSFFGYAQARF